MIVTTIFVFIILALVAIFELFIWLVLVIVEGGLTDLLIVIIVNVIIVKLLFILILHGTFSVTVTMIDLMQVLLIVLWLVRRWDETAGVGDSVWMMMLVMLLVLVEAMVVVVVPVLGFVSNLAQSLWYRLLLRIAGGQFVHVFLVFLVLLILCPLHFPLRLVRSLGGFLLNILDFLVGASLVLQHLVVSFLGLVACVRFGLLDLLSGLLLRIFDGGGGLFLRIFHLDLGIFVHILHFLVCFLLLFHDFLLGLLFLGQNLLFGVRNLLVGRFLLALGLALRLRYLLIGFLLGQLDLFRSLRLLYRLVLGLGLLKDLRSWFGLGLRCFLLPVSTSIIVLLGGALRLRTLNLALHLRHLGGRAARIFELLDGLHCGCGGLSHQLLGTF